MKRRPILPAGALVLFVVLLPAHQAFAQQTYDVIIRKTGVEPNVKYHADKPASFGLKEGEQITWFITNTTGDSITVRAENFRCRQGNTPPPTCPIDWPGCSAEVRLNPQGSGPLTGVAQSSGCRSGLWPPWKRPHDFDFVVVTGQNGRQKIDPRLDIDKGGFLSPPAVLLMFAATALLVVYVLYRFFTRRRHIAR